MSSNLAPSRKRIRTIPGNCIASGNCSVVAPTLFGHDDQGVVVARVTRVSAEQLSDALTAVAACPVAAIELEDDPGNVE